MGNSPCTSTGTLVTFPCCTGHRWKPGSLFIETDLNKVRGADFYEIEFANNMLYTTIRNTELLFDGLEAENRLICLQDPFQTKTVIPIGLLFNVKTKSNPLEFAIKGIWWSNCRRAGWFEIFRLFDFAELGDMFHNKYRKNAIPFDMIIDLRTVNQLDTIPLSVTSGRR